MSGSPFSRTADAGVRPDRGSDAPLAVDIDVDMDGSTGSALIPLGWADRIPRSWLGISGYLLAGVMLGLVLIVALSLMRSDRSAKAAASAGIVTDNVVYLGAHDIGATCWRGADTSEPARVTVSLEVGLDGKVRNAIAAGETPALRGCVESLVKTWEFLPQAASSQMVLPFEIATR